MQTRRIIVIGLLFNLISVIVTYTLILFANEKLFQSLVAYGLLVFVAGTLSRYFVQQTLSAEPEFLDRDAAVVLFAIEVAPGMTCVAGYLYLALNDPNDDMAWPFLIAPLLMGTSVVQLLG